MNEELKGLIVVASLTVVAVICVHFAHTPERHTSAYEPQVNQCPPRDAGNPWCYAK